MQKNHSSKKPAPKGAKTKTVTSAPEDRLNLAIEEAATIMREGIKDGRFDIASGEGLRDAADHFLLCASYRFDNIAPAGRAHKRYGYDADHLREIDYNLARISSGNRRPIHDNLRLDNILNNLVHEARALVKSQSVYCQECEHCIRENPDLAGKRELTTENTLDPKTFDFVVMRFSEMFDGTEGEKEIVSVLRHLESLACVNRPGAIKDAVNRLIGAMLDGTTDKDELRKEYEDESREQVVSSQKWYENEMGSRAGA